MYERFLRMFVAYGELAAYLLLKVETNTLTKEDVELAQKEETNGSTLVRVIYGCLEDEPDLVELTKEGLNAIAFDLNLEDVK